jgi:subtilisin family serine protease
MNTPDDAWRSKTGRGVSIAIVDSGIDTTHADLKERVRESVESVVEGNKVSFVESNSGDAAGHGTACAGIIASIAPDAEIYSIKYLDLTRRSRTNFSSRLRICHQETISRY